MTLLQYRLLQGDVRKRLAELPDNSVHNIVTSPPYYGLRDYGAEGQIGQEDDWRAHIAVLAGVFEECRRVLRPDGTLWVNYGDAYAQQGCKPATQEELARYQAKAEEKGYYSDAYSGYRGWNRAAGTAKNGLKPKDLMGLPWRLAFALQDSGWWLRADCIWSKANPMPMPARGRPTTSHEYVFLFAKSRYYYYDTEAVRVPLLVDEKRKRQVYNGKSARTSTFMPPNPNGRNLWTVWHFACQPCPEAHFATFPEALPEICIRAGTSAYGCCEECGAPWERVLEATPEGKELLGKSWHPHENDLVEGHTGKILPAGVELYRTTGWKPTCKCACLSLVPATVLDPFAGSSTTGVVALREGRQFLGIELNPEYCRISQERLEAARQGMSVQALRSGQLGLFA